MKPEGLGQIKPHMSEAQPENYGLIHHGVTVLRVA